MIKKYIPIGCQCISTNVIEKLKVRVESLPFDWMLSHPSFVFTILDMLLDEKYDVDDIVRNHFYCQLKKCKFDVKEHYYYNINGFAYGNSKYGVVLPHENDNHEETVTKYKRRMERLRELILNKDLDLTFLYVSPVSKRDHFSVDGVMMTETIYSDINKIYNLLKSKVNKFEFIVCDSILNENRDVLDSGITLITLPTNIVKSLDLIDLIVNKINALPNQ